ncbi:MAG TPA: ADOP family duplicated permease [Opitutaceae bacterium]|nr:ADOP family duplicated permease [Opitutaceae bacterium]
MKLLRKFRALFRKEKLDAEMSEEMRVHLELQAAENEKRGIPPEEARYAASRSFGGVEQIKERARDERRRGFIWLEQAVQDTRYAARTLRKNLGFSLVIAGTLALGIGLNTVVFSFYHAVAMKPLAVRDPHEILRLSLSPRDVQGVFNFDEFQELRARMQSVDAVIATSQPQLAVATHLGAAGETSTAVSVSLVSDNYFLALGVPAVAGRTLGSGDTAAAVIGYEAWQRWFKGDLAAVGQTVLLQNVPVLIVGVAPERFGGTGLPPTAPDFWLPASAQPLIMPAVDWLHDPGARVWAVLARQKAGHSLPQIAAELEVVAHTWPKLEDKPLQPHAAPATFFELHGPEVHAVGLTLMIAVALILLVGCINVLNLVAARNAQRRHELAVRLALGASRGRILRQLGTESALLGLLGGAGGWLLAWWACAAIHVWTMDAMREISGSWNLFLDLTPDATVFIYTFMVSLAAGAFVGLWPAIRATAVNVEEALKQQSSGRIAGGGRSRRNILLTVQVGACLLLLTGAGLLFRGAAHAVATNPGFDAKHVVVATANLRQIASSPEQQVVKMREITARLRTVPGIVSVAGADRSPFFGHSITSLRTDEERFVPGCVLVRADPEYFDTLGLRFVAGRPFTTREAESGAPVVVITESAARHLWPGQEALGRRLAQPKRSRDETAGQQFTVIGIVKDARFTLLSKVDEVDVFFPRTPAEQELWLIRTSGAPEAALQSIFAALRAIDPLLPSQTTVLTMEGGPMRVQRLMAEAPATFATLLGIVALVLASIGIFGVVSFFVARRTREIGIRFALGAQKSEVIGLVLWQTLRPALWGVGFGFAGALALCVLLTRLVLDPELPDLTYGAGAVPSATLAEVLAMLLAVIFIAALIPARRAAKVDPMVALRAE